MEGMGEDGEDPGKIFKMDDGGGLEDARVYNQEEVKRSKLRTRAAKRVWGFEEKSRKGKGGELARVCWEEVREKGRGGRESVEMGGRQKEVLRRKGMGSEGDGEGKERRRYGVEGSGKKR